MSVNKDDHFTQEKKKKSYSWFSGRGSVKKKWQRHVWLEHMQEVKNGKGKVQKESKEMSLLVETK